MQVTVELPETILGHFKLKELPQLLKLKTALLLFQAKQFSIGASCEFAGVDIHTFYAECKKHNIPVIDYPSEELEEEVREYERIKKQKSELC